MPMTPEEMANALGDDFPAGDVDPQALDEVRRRLARTRLGRTVITYSDLVSGIAFHHASFWPHPHIIDTHDWTGLDRQMIGGVLARLSVESLRRRGYLIGALVVEKAEPKPSKVFFDWLYDTGVITDGSEVGYERFWVEQMNLAHADRIP